MKNQSICSSEVALREAIKFAGGQSALARVCKKQQGHVSHWLKSGKGVPAEYCPLIEEATGVTCERLRPDVRWDVVRLSIASTSEPTHG